MSASPCWPVAGSFLTVRVGAIKEDADDDHSHRTLFQNGAYRKQPRINHRYECSRHPAGVNYVFGGGSVRILKESIALAACIRR